MITQNLHKGSSWIFLFLRIYVKDYHIQNLELFEQSCEDELKKKVLENTKNTPDLEKGGPLFMMDVITSNTEEAIPTLTLKLSTFMITSTQGEICKVISHLLLYRFPW